MECILSGLGSPIKVPLLLRAIHVTVGRPVTFERYMIGKIFLLTLQLLRFFYKARPPVFIGDGDAYGRRIALPPGRRNIYKPIRASYPFGIGRRDLLPLRCLRSWGGIRRTEGINKTLQQLERPKHQRNQTATLIGFSFSFWHTLLPNLFLNSPQGGSHLKNKMVVISTMKKGVPKQGFLIVCYCRLGRLICLMNISAND